jgi:UDPglucose 6-dehydrogenase
VLGLTFKPNTDDMREAPSLTILPALQEAGAEIRAFDPEGLDEARPLLPGIAFCADAYQAMDGADAVVLLTEWNEFRALDTERMRRLLKSPTLIDLRNVYKPAEMAAAGFFYFSIGRRPVEPARTEQRVLSSRT